MLPNPHDYEVLGALHDGTIVAFDRQDDGSLLMQVEIEYLADRLEADSTMIRIRMDGASPPSARFESWSTDEDSTFPKDLLVEQDLNLTLLSLSDATGAARDEIGIDCVGGTLRLSFSTITFESESGVAIPARSLERASRLYWERWSARNSAAKLDLTVRSATATDLPVLRSLYSELLSVLATYNPTVDPNLKLQSDWVEKPDELFAWLVHRRDSAGRLAPVGMALVCGKAYTEALGGNGDYWLYEFVVTESERRNGIGKASLALVLDAHEGEWCLDVLPQNEPAMTFWKAALDHYEPERVQYTDDEGVEFVRFTFHTRVPLT